MLKLLSAALRDFLDVRIRRQHRIRTTPKSLQGSLF